MSEQRHIDIIKHSLGWPKNYRNHFVTGPGSKDWDTLNEMAELGLMTKREYPLAQGDYIFHVTDAGRALLAGPDAA